jgi:ubiquinone/menaquinone biosynthesis C-methylase UbiE
MKEDLARRIAECPPEKRRLLERLLKQRGVELPLPGAEPENPAVSTMVDALRRAVPESEDAPEGTPPPELYTNKDVVRANYGAYHDVLQSAIFEDEAVFMNLGYVENDRPQHSPVQLPERMLGRPFAKLALEVIGDCDLNGRRVLDIGCGRGGTIQLVHAHFRPSETVGLDLTREAIEFCRKRYSHPDTRFEVGDAEDLPFDDGSFDVVTNIESSHHYPHIDRFYREVYRTLAQGGHFLYATVLVTERFAPELDLLRDLGFVVVRDQDITTNVLASCDANQGALFPGVGDMRAESGMANAVGLPGSGIYDDMKCGRMAYRMLSLRKPGRDSGHE